MDDPPIIDFTSDFGTTIDFASEIAGADFHSDMGTTVDFESEL